MTHLGTIRSGLAFLAGVFSASHALADFVPVSQARSVAAHASATAPGVTPVSNSQTLASSDLADFIADTQVAAPVTATTFSSGVGTQVSVLSPHALVGSLRASTRIESRSTSTSTHGDGTSLCSVTFDITETSTVRILATGLVGARNLGGGSAPAGPTSSFRLESVDSGATIAILSAVLGSDAATLNTTPLLPAGRYTLTAIVSTELSGLNHARYDEHASLSFSITTEPSAPAPYAPVSQARSVAAMAQSTGLGSNPPPESVSDSDAARDFGPFSSAASVNLVTGFGSGSGTSRQNSAMFPGVISVVSLADGLARSGSFSTPGECNLSSSYEFVFDVPETLNTLLVADALAAGTTFGTASSVTGACVVELRNVDTNQVIQSITTEVNAPPHAVNAVSALPPARYSLRVVGASEVYSGFTAGESTADLHIAVTLVRLPSPFCLADWDHSGDVNSQDFFDFLAAFFSEASPADVNHDGVINSADFFDFLAAFFTGC